MEDLRNFIMTNDIPEISDEERNELRGFVAQEATISANMAIPNTIGGQDSDEDIPDDVHDHEIDDTDSTTDDERTGDTGIQPGSGKKKPKPMGESKLGVGAALTAAGGYYYGRGSDARRKARGQTKDSTGRKVARVAAGLAVPTAGLGYIIGKQRSREGKS